MKINLLTVALPVGSLISSSASADSRATITPNVNVQPAGPAGGVIVTPSIHVEVPVSRGGTTFTGNVQVPTYVPPSGQPQAQPQFNVGLRIPVGG